MNAISIGRFALPPAVTGHWKYAIALALIPIPIAWLIVYGFVALGRWIRAGFKLT